MWSVVPIRGGSNQSGPMSKYYPITTRLWKLLTLSVYFHCPCKVLVNCCSWWHTELQIFDKSIKKAATKKWRQLAVGLTNLHLCLLPVWTVSFLFMVCRSRDFQHSIRSTAGKTRWQLMTLQVSTRVCHLFELLVNCKFALCGSESFRPSEPKETNALNTCNVKWPH